MYSNEADYVAATDVSCGLGCIGNPTNEFTCVYNPCSPWVSVPTQVYGLDQKFQTCIDGIKAFFDPPYTLTSGGGLVPFSSVPASASSAAPAQTPAPVIAAPTPTPTSNKPTPTPTPSPDPPSPPNNVNPPNPKQPASLTPATPNDPSSPNADPPSKDPPSPIAIVGSVTVAIDHSSNIVVGSKTLAPGDPAVTTDGHTFSLAPSGSGLVIDGATSAIPNYTPLAGTVGILTTAPNGATALVLAGGQTVTAGSVPITVGGTTYSLSPGGSSIVVNGNASPVPTPGPHIITSAGTPYLVVGSQTILPGSSAVIIAGTTYSLASSGNALVIDGTSEYIVGSQTLVAGGSAITVSGTVVSLLSGGQSVVVGGTTGPISNLLESTGSSGLGGAIMTIGGFTTNGSGGSNVTEFTGGVGRLGGGKWVGKEVLGVGAAWMSCLVGVLIL